jgi:hypothetical protein
LIDPSKQGVLNALLTIQGILLENLLPDGDNSKIIQAGYINACMIKHLDKMYASNDFKLDQSGD